MVRTQDLSIDVDGKSMPCYLARPDGEDAKPAVIVFQEIFGVNREVKRIAELFASAGYLALAPNYYYRTHPALNEPYTDEGLQRGFAAAGQVTKANLLRDTTACIDWLNAQSFTAKGNIATCGFCFGGMVSFLTATLPGLKAAIPFYGGFIAKPLPSGDPEPLAGAKDIRVPLLLFFGAKDDYIPKEEVERIDRTLTQLGKPHEVVVYPNVGHAFFRESSDSLHKDEVSDAWERVQHFLKQHLSR